MYRGGGSLSARLSLAAAGWRIIIGGAAKISARQRRRRNKRPRRTLGSMGINNIGGVRK